MNTEELKKLIKQKEIVLQRFIDQLLLFVTQEFEKENIPILILKYYGINGDEYKEIQSRPSVVDSSMPTLKENLQLKQAYDKKAIFKQLFQLCFQKLLENNDVSNSSYCLIVIDQVFQKIFTNIHYLREYLDNSSGIIEELKNFIGKKIIETGDSKEDLVKQIKVFFDTILIEIDKECKEILQNHNEQYNINQQLRKIRC